MGGPRKRRSTLSDFSLQDHTDPILLLRVDATDSPNGGLPESVTFSIPPTTQIMRSELGGPRSEGGVRSL